MQQDLRSIAAATPVHPLPPHEPVTDATLHMLAKGEPDWQRGDISEEFQAILVMALPDICNELLLWRQATANRPFALALALRSEAIETRLADARRTIRAPDPIHPRTLTAACETLLRHSTDAAERAAASDVLARMQGAAQ